MSRLDEYTFMVTDLLTGDVLSTVEMSSFHWEEIYNRPGVGLGTARIDLPTTTPENFKDFSNGFWAVKDGEIQWAGIIGRVQRRGQTRVISVPVVGFFEYFRNRILRSAIGMNHGQLVRTSDIEWRNVDQFHIFQDMILHAQHESFEDGNIGIGVEWDSLSGQSTTMIYRTFTVKYIGAALTTLANRLNGFDFRQVYRFENDVPKCNFKLSHPPHNTVSNDVLLFQPEREETVSVTVLRALDLDGTVGDYAHAGDATSVIADIDIIVHAKMDDWSPTSVQYLRSKWGASGNRSWYLRLNTDGKLQFGWSEDGTVEQTKISDSAVSFANGEEGTVRVTMDVYLSSKGSEDIIFYESSDGGKTWTSLTTDPYESTYVVGY